MEQQVQCMLWFSEDTKHGFKYKATDHHYTQHITGTQRHMYVHNQFLYLELKPNKTKKSIIQLEINYRRERGLTNQNIQNISALVKEVCVCVCVCV